MRLQDIIAKRAEPSSADATPNSDASQRIARLQHIAMLQDKASQVIAAAEAALDRSLYDCPSLDEAGDGTLRALRKAH